MFLDPEMFCEEMRPIVKVFNAEYNYLYLNSMHEIINKYDVNTIITGISYGLNGVNPMLLKWKSVNLAMHSQDLYYDFLHIKKAVRDNPGKIKRWIITLGYYGLHYDLSRALYKVNCGTIYWPLFEDLHNMKVEEFGNGLGRRPGKVVRDFALNFFEKNPYYYGPAISYEQTMPEVGQMYGTWENMPLEDKLSSGKEIAEKHNKHINHDLTFEENKEIFRAMIKFAEENAIMPIVVMMPCTNEYLQFLNFEYKEILLDYLERLPYEIHYIDLNDCDLFLPEDFLNCNHLNARGAEKVSKIINNLF